MPINQENAVIYERIPEIDTASSVFIKGVLVSLSSSDQQPINGTSAENVIKLYFTDESFVYIDKSTIHDTKIADMNILCKGMINTELMLESGAESPCFCVNKATGDGVSEWLPARKMAYLSRGLENHLDKLEDAEKAEYESLKGYVKLYTPIGGGVRFHDKGMQSLHEKLTTLAHIQD